MLGFLPRKSKGHSELLISKLYDESTFYTAFEKDLKNCDSELIIESPFVTNRRFQSLLPTLQKLKARKVRIIINTKDPQELDEDNREEAYRVIASLQHKGIQVIYIYGHHRKLAIIDRSILYEGSLNILSQNRSCEVMRRTESVRMAWEMVRFIMVDAYM